MIIHVDMDAFYASVEQLDQPELMGKPVVVGGTPEQRGVVAAASYEARKFGVRSAMPSSTAVRLCPTAIFIPMRMSRYKEFSEKIQDIFLRYTPLVEPLSLDEAFLDVTDSIQLFGDTANIGMSIKNDIRSQLGLTASIGIAPNKFLAKIASDLEKPDGFVQVPESCQNFLDTLPVTRLWGIGKVASKKLDKLDIHTIKDFRLADRRRLEQVLGHNIEQLSRLANGEDNRKVLPELASKSISRETTFATDIRDLETLESVLMNLTEDVAFRLRRKNMFARTVGIKLRFADFTTITRDQTHTEPTDVTQAIWQSARTLLHSALGDRKFRIRLIGIHLQSLVSELGQNPSLFNQTELQRQSQVDSVVDSINTRFGDSTVHRGIAKHSSEIQND